MCLDNKIIASIIFLMGSLNYCLVVTGQTELRVPSRIIYDWCSADRSSGGGGRGNFKGEFIFLEKICFQLILFLTIGNFDFIILVSIYLKI